MIVRLADPYRDASEILAGAKDFISRMDFTAGLPESDAELADAIGHLIGHGMEIAVAEHDGRIVGGIGMFYAPFPWNRKLLNASEMFIWASPSAPPAAFLSLLRFVERRAAERGAGLKEFVALTSSPPALAKVYARMNLSKVQETWMGVV